MTARSGNTTVIDGEAGFVVASRVGDLEAYDALPAVVRQAVSGARINLACAPLLDFWTGEHELDCVERVDALLTGIQSEAA